MVLYLNRLQADLHPKVKLVHGSSTTYDGRHIWMVIVKPYLDRKVRNPRPRERKKFWIEAGLYARATCTNTVFTALKFIHKMATEPREEYRFHDYYIMPMMN